MGIPNHNLDGLEQRRLALEDNILQLQKSLYHWRIWEAEYDGLREELNNLDNDATTEDFLAAGREYGASLVTEEELQTILGLGRPGITRSRGQVVDLLGRRIDYVKQNLTTMEKTLRSAQDELSALDPTSPATADSGAPMREIMEELDEEGKIISSSVNNPGDHATQLLETLKKAGVEDIPENSAAADSASASASAEPEQDAKDTDTTEDQKTAKNDDCTPAPELNEVTQDVDIDPMHPVSLVTAEDRKQPPVTDIDESPEEAKLRREMLQYGIDEVGAIVAELELDEDGSEFSFDEDDFDEEDNEDEFGRSYPVLSDEYHQQMRELEAKLNARGMFNMGKDTNTFPDDVRQEIEQSAAAEESVATNGNTDTKDKKVKKRVAFADDLDIAPAPESVAVEKKEVPLPRADIPVLSDAIVERTGGPQAEPRAASAAAPNKVSRFKSARAAAPAGDSPAASPFPPHPTQPVSIHATRAQTNAIPSTTPPALFPARPQEPKPFSLPILDAPIERSVPRPPEGKTLADKLVEREIAPGSAAAPEPDELDEEIHRREIASEFYRIRNSKIQQQGGFVNTEEPEFEPIEEPTKRVSKFKAARLR
ncbi:hypothetical protein N7462_008356 [Penicillium macrosclerotiorum]|uniref:uncharacterized protein n=1 Tax=Penicillium macrosclerotiorum TaxID=303699 RepID=UPI00254941C0|nr:uncharacterized protein N7462_008356 [Penicillium macrosclerotiorum]KAJ5675459.1 hypothetical protein N7462_008356 [Penicillium macrosclerotiorum]